ncbi:hypothetical protein KIN20_003793 [Parelaphostrongylus tenuis]|uniref:Uncharacterized protein n=1 Tax=Parelaphostrongylus tenuis TaxID=148309 RepID=A0AAD5LZP8_PARTN|nr:hypothetical protein KIN20_003793 [Parelaphostrongylus tenuis]
MNRFSRGESLRNFQALVTKCIASSAETDCYRWASKGSTRSRSIIISRTATLTYNRSLITTNQRQKQAESNKNFMILMYGIVEQELRYPGDSKLKIHIFHWKRELTAESVAYEGPTDPQDGRMKDDALKWQDRKNDMI